jgi:hypothetical protein
MLDCRAVESLRVVVYFGDRRRKSGVKEQKSLAGNVSINDIV